MHPFFFGVLLGSSGVESMEEFCEPDDVNQFMSHYVRGKGKKTDFPVALDRPADHVVLDADLEKIPRLASPGLFTGASEISPDLSESVIGDFFFAKVAQALNIIAVSFPLGSRNLVKIAYEFFRNFYGLSQGNDFVCLEG
jgi:hypothetical protein